MTNLQVEVGQLKFLCESGQFFASKGKYAEASDIFRAVIALAPDRSIGYTLLGDAYLNWEKFDEALQSHEKALEVEPNNTFARVHYGEALLLRKQKEKGMQELRKVADQDPNGADGALARQLIRGAEQGLFAKV